MRHIKYIILNNICQQWENGKLSSLDFLKLVCDLVLTQFSEEEWEIIKSKNKNLEKIDF